MRRQWRALEEAGVPSLARHRGTTHRPHLTLVSGGQPDAAAVLDLARAVLLPPLPLTASVAGPVLLGGRRSSLAHRLQVPEALRVARELLVARWPGADRRPWVPHVSLTRRTHKRHLFAALTALRPPGPDVRLVEVRWWDPETGTVTHL
ncbi:2'-5' RNA ligase family protein [Ornithinimicrobium sp. W1665]|uniref:2'-5' RNA ligase family protein n=1 Tax=Ornithinimicrobium sp. W1665 TaxID=3416666 RepID=UPI003D6BDD65